MKYKIFVYFVIIPLVPFFLADLQLRGKRSESDDVCKETTMKQFKKFNSYKGQVWVEETIDACI